jgi:GNAT superfamily N-acetyltransferase
VTSPAIRPAVPGDEDGIALVHVRSWQEAYRGHMPQDFLDGLDVGQRAEMWHRRLAAARQSRGGVIVLESEGTIAGFAQFGPSRDDDANQNAAREPNRDAAHGPNPDAAHGLNRDANHDADGECTGEIDAIYLRPESIGQGLGQLLMSWTVDALTRLGYTSATLWVLDGNTRARRFYERAGWSADGAVKEEGLHEFTIREVRYRRALP